MNTYTVRRGDTLSKIAKDFNFTLKRILSVNPQIYNPNIIRIGQVINLPISTGGNITANESFIGKFRGTAEDLVRMFERANTNQNTRARRLAPYYIKWGEIFNIRADLAWCQMIHETGHLAFRGDVAPHQNNFVGLGATGGVPGNSFRTEKLGVIAHFAHLAWYYFKDHVNKYCSKEYDPRHFGTYHYKYTGDTSIDFLSGQWAVPGRYKQPDGSIITYGGQIANLANNIFISDNNEGEKLNVKLSQKIKDATGLETIRNWQYIAIHHSVSSQFNTTMAQIRRWHLARNFLREGYNFGVKGNGELEVGRPITMSGAHVGPRWNSVAIGICLYGDFRYNSLTEAQRASAYDLCKAMMHEFDISYDRVLGHNEFEGQHTLCPVIDMDEFRAGLHGM